jgi:tight adherence protein C
MMMLWLVLALLLLALAGVLVLMSNQDQAAPEAEKRFHEALETPQDETWLNQRKWRRARSITQRVKRLLERLPGTDMDEIEVLLRQAALADDRYRSMIYTSLWLLPAAGLALGSAYATMRGSPLTSGLAVGFVMGYILPRSTLRVLAERRQKAIKEEMPIVLNLMRLLFDAGLSLEHTLKAISEQAGQITPHLSNEFAWVLSRIQHGQERGDAMDEMAKRNDVSELSETVAMLKQASRYGGNLRESLLRYLRLLEDRRLTDLKDKVGKLSANMSIVMMLFLFPALLIFLAGPGMIAIKNAFSGFK